MEDVLKADIFFFTTTIVVVVLGILVAVVLAYLIKILHELKTLVRTARAEIDRIVADVGEVREDVKERIEGLLDLADSRGIRGGLMFLMETIFSGRRRKRRSRKDEE